VVAHLSVETEAHQQSGLLRLEVDIARAVAHRRPENGVERFGGITAAVGPRCER
jgi:hypothetical protein